ncbi:hypothetical protein MLD38_025441 [Melastoma candidum]|uniref:Uncharacterized protein n=1 Tax=Melastoma candidum TaxID=119954 RepID=A0ACB9NWZ5_9MYRT|nr:hypothetical protein MLD38_025441 [Melastoma candidum]
MSEQLERFFHGRHTQHQQPISPASIALLSGPPFCGKTSLLFQFAYNVAASMGETRIPSVVFISRRLRLEANPPCLSGGIDPSSDAFRRIQIKYVDDDEGLRKYFAAFHLLKTVPASVIVDDFGELFDERSCQQKYANHRGRDMAMVRTLALCHNAIVHANKTSPCELLLADMQHGDSPRLLYIYKRWVSSILTIRGDGYGSFLLRSEVRANSGRRIAAKYSIALHFLLLDEITDDPLE